MDEDVAIVFGSNLWLVMDQAKAFAAGRSDGLIEIRDAYCDVMNALAATF